MVTTLAMIGPYILCTLLTAHFVSQLIMLNIAVSLHTSERRTMGSSGLA